MPRHRQVRIEHEGVSAEVDEGIAPLILALWRLGFRTLASCESWPVLSERVGRDTAYVSFETGEEAGAFAGIVGSVSSVLVRGEPDDAVKVKVESDPAYAAEVAARGGAWMIGFPATDLQAVQTASGLQASAFNPVHSPAS